MFPRAMQQEAYGIGIEPDRRSSEGNFEMGGRSTIRGEPRGEWKHRSRIAGFLGAWVVAGSAAAAEQGGCLSGRTEVVWVERVVAEDVVDLVDGRRVKLSGIAPARAPLDARGVAWREGARAAESTARRQLAEIAEGRELALHDLGEDRHGRRRGHLVDTESGHWIEAELVRAGLVRVGSAGERGACMSDLMGAEAEARRARRGLWGSELFGVRSPLDVRLDEMVGAMAVVEGRVRSVGRSGGRTYLNFGDDFRRDFAVVLDDNHRGTLMAAGFDAEKARGRDVLVRGIIVRREGLRIEIAAPEDIEWAKR